MNHASRAAAFMRRVEALSAGLPNPNPSWAVAVRTPHSSRPASPLRSDGMAGPTVHTAGRASDLSQRNPLTLVSHGQEPSTVREGETAEMGKSPSLATSSSDPSQVSNRLVELPSSSWRGQLGTLSGSDGSDTAPQEDDRPVVAGAVVTSNP